MDSGAFYIFINDIKFCQGGLVSCHSSGDKIQTASHWTAHRRSHILMCWMSSSKEKADNVKCVLTRNLVNVLYILYMPRKGSDGNFLISGVTFMLKVSKIREWYIIKNLDPLHVTWEQPPSGRLNKRLLLSWELKSVVLSPWWSYISTWCKGSV